MQKNLTVNFQKLITTIVFGGYFLNCLSEPTSWHFIDSVDLVIHEAGHTCMRFFGEFIYIFGGSFFQFLIPFIFLVYFLRRLDYFSSSLLLTWLGYNLINVSIYIHDAIVMQLDLLGGDSVIHDWNYLLTNTGLLPHTYEIAFVVQSIGAICIITSLVLSLWFCFENKTTPFTT